MALFSVLQADSAIGLWLVTNVNNHDKMPFFALLFCNLFPMCGVLFPMCGVLIPMCGVLM